MRTYLLSHLLSTQAHCHGPRPVLEIDGETTSYADLEAMSGRLAGALAAAGLGYQDRIGIHLPKGLAAYAALFAALELGATYVPLDTAAPVARVRYMLRDGGLEALATTAALAPEILDGMAAGERPDLLVVDGDGADRLPSGPRCIDLRQALESGPPAVESPAIEDDLAYVLYTSGSTGRPKGVMVSHRNALAFVEWAAEAFGIGPGDRVAAVAALHFDLSVFDLFATIAGGATLLPLPAGILARPRQLTAWIASAQISVWYSTPSTLVLLLEEGDLAQREYPHLRHLLFAGEVFPTKHLRRLKQALPGARLYNLYGPTETNVCTWKPVDAVPDEDHETISLGRACRNTEVVAWADGREAAVGEEGELWVRGPTVMRGYWGDAEKTAAALQPLPGRSLGNDLWYRTGDLVHRDGDGELHFHGRRDHMVKVRGYRVEIGEVETALYAHPDIRELAVVAVTDEEGRVSRLRACIVPHNADDYSPVRLKAFLGQHLPAYMIPAEMLCLQALPKTSTGKVDRRALATQT